MELLAYLGLFLIMITSMELLVGSRLRLDIVTLAIQYLAVFFLILQVWPLGMAAVKLLAGWVAAGMIILKWNIQKDNLSEVSFRSGQLFRILVGFLVWILIFSVTSSVAKLIQIPTVLIWAALILIGVGLLQISMSVLPIRIIFGLLTTFSGFEILYSAMENSMLVMGLLAIVTLGFGVIAAFLVQPKMDAV